MQCLHFKVLSQAPAEENFDQIVAMLKDTTASCPVIFNCQVNFKMNHL